MIKLSLPHTGRKTPAIVVGLDIVPGFVSAAQVSVNGEIRVERAVGVDLPPDAVRDGEILDAGAVADAIRGLFRAEHLSTQVRIGIANQRSVLRIIELPVINDRKELAAAVRFQAEDRLPMSLATAVLDFELLDVVQADGGPLQRVAVVAAQRETVDELLKAVRMAGLQPVGIDLSAFALVRALRGPGATGTGRTAYLTIDGLSNLAVCEGLMCVFTRMLSPGLEDLAGELADRQAITRVQARELLGRVGLPDPEAAGPLGALGEDSPEGRADSADPLAQAARAVLAGGVARIAAQVRNSLEFQLSQEPGPQVERVVMSGLALDIPGFHEAVERELRIPVHPARIAGSVDAFASVPASRVAVAAGLAVSEAPR
jgi:type IV pilus assembly protein PilM